MFRKKLLVLPLVCMLVLSACTASNPQELTSTSSVSSELSSSVSETELLEDDELITEFLQLVDESVKVIFWWLGPETLEVEDDAEPYLEVYYPVKNFHSIKELKEATEKAVTKQFAETYLYTVITDLNIVRFIDYQGKLYYNRDQGLGGYPFEEIREPKVKSKSENAAVITVTVYDRGLKKDLQFDFDMVKEEDGWKLNSFFDMFSAS